jgi:hypothetical protein
VVASAWRRIALGAALLALAACATKSGMVRVSEAKQALDAALICCTTLAEAARAPLPTTEADLDIGPATAQAFDFGGNKAFFKLFELPPYSRVYSIVISSASEGTVADLALFIPRVALYDADFKVTRFFDEKTLRNRGDTLERTVFVNPSNAAERYLAVFGSDLSASIERSYSAVTVTPVFAGPVAFNIYGGVDGKSTLRSSPAGRLRIEVQGLTTPAK